MSKKLDNTREVVFEEDYNPTKKVAIYKKGETHYIHYSIVELLKGQGAKFKAKEIDQKKMIAEAAEAHRKANKVTED